jgi:hypothetical protein
MAALKALANQRVASAGAAGGSSRCCNLRSTRTAAQSALSGIRWRGERRTQLDEVRRENVREIQAMGGRARPKELFARLAPPT